MRRDSVFPWYYSQLLVIGVLVALDIVYFVAPWEIPSTGLGGAVTRFLTDVLAFVFIPGLVFSLIVNQAIMFSRRAKETLADERRVLGIEFAAIAACVLLAIFSDWVGAFVILQVTCIVLAMLAFGAIHEGSARSRDARAAG